MKEKSIDCSRLLRACGLFSRDNDINTRVLHFLNQSLAQNVAELNKAFELAKKEARDVLLGKLRELKTFEQCWRLGLGLELVIGTDFLSLTDPELTGVLTKIDNKAPVLITQNDVDSSFGLWISLTWWRDAICAIWSATIIRDLIFLTNNLNNRALLLTGESLTEEAHSLKKVESIGSIIALEEIADESADTFYRLCDTASFGSITCEENTAIAFREFLKKVNVGLLQDLGLSFEASHAVLLAGSQHYRPKMVIKLAWDQNKKQYAFVAFVENNDQHGYLDPNRTSSVPQKLLLYFYESAPREVKEDLVRLLLRAGLERAKFLLISRLVTSLD